MGKIKVYEIAKELGITNIQVIEKLNNMGVDVKTHLSTITDEVANKLKNLIIL